MKKYDGSQPKKVPTKRKRKESEKAEEGNEKQEKGEEEGSKKKKRKLTPAQEQEMKQREEIESLLEKNKDKALDPITDWTAVGLKVWLRTSAHKKAKEIPSTKAKMLEAILAYLKELS